MLRHSILTTVVLAATLAAGACKPAPTAVPATVANDEVPATAAELAPPLTPRGTPEVVTAVGADDDSLQTAAGVQQVEYFSEQPIHLFGVSSGDPGPNGFHVYAAFFAGGNESVIFPIADATAYEVVSVQPGKIGIKLTSVDYPAGGEATETESRIIVSWTTPPDGDAPTSVTVTPAA